MDFLPTKKLSQNLHSDIGINIETAKNELQSSDSNTVRLQIKSIMKKIIRTAFSIIMEEENYWTTDLSEMTDIFIKYYPSKQQEIIQILKISKNDSTDKTRALNILNDFGEWIICEFSQKISNQIYD